MAGDWHFAPEQEEAREKADEAFKEQSRQYNEDAFKPDSEKKNTKADVAGLMAYETFASIYETICFNVIAEAGGKMFQPLFNAIRKNLSKFVSKKFINSFLKQAKLLDEGKITTKQFLEKAQKYGKLANKYFVDDGDVEEYVSKALREQVQNVDEIAGEKWVKEAAEEVGDSKLRTVTKSVEALAPSNTTNHIKNVGLMLDNYINTPEIAEWLAKEGYDVDKLKSVIKLVGESHDDGKLLVLLNDIETSRQFPTDPITKKKINPVTTHEPKGESLLKELLTPEEDVIPGAKGESFSSMANKHGRDKAETPLEQLVAVVDQMESALSPRSYKAGKSPYVKEEVWRNGSVHKSYDWKAIEDKYNFPDEVKKALGDNYADYYADALSQRLGKKVNVTDEWFPDVEPAQDKLINNPLANYYEYERQSALRGQETAARTARVLGVNAAKADKEVPKVSKHKIRQEAYDKYNSAYPYPRGMPSNLRKIVGFVLGTAGVDPSTIRYRVIEEGDPEVLKASLNDFNTKFQNSDRDDYEKEAIQFITDNWDNLSDADKAYFKSRIEYDNKDWINQYSKTP